MVKIKAEQQEALRLVTSCCLIHTQIAFMEEIVQEESAHFASTLKSLTVLRRIFQKESDALCAGCIDHG
jgi:hypothetical protein